MHKGMGYDRIFPSLYVYELFSPLAGTLLKMKILLSDIWVLVYGLLTRRGSSEGGLYILAFVEWV